MLTTLKVRRSARRARIAAVMCAGALAIAACSGQGANGSSAGTGGNGGDDKTYNVALIRWSPDDIYFNGVQYGEELEAKRIEKAEGVKINFTVIGANDVSAQVNGLRAQMAKGVDGVSLVPWRGEAMTNLVKQLREKNIPVVTHNAYVPDAPQTFVAFDNERAGELAGQAIVDTLEKNRGPDWAKRGGVIIELRCIITASFDIGRHKGYHKVLDPIVRANPGLKIETREAGCDGGKARTAVDDIMSRYGKDKVLGVASIDGTMGVGGAIPAFKSAGVLFPSSDRRHIPVTTIDCTQPELDSIAKGELTHCSEQPAIAEGVITMRLLWDMMKNGTTEPSKGAEKSSSDGQQPWQPVRVIESKDFDGAWYQTQAFSVPGDLPPDDPKHWAVASK